MLTHATTQAITQTITQVITRELTRELTHAEAPHPSGCGASRLRAGATCRLLVCDRYASSNHIWSKYESTAREPAYTRLPMTSQFLTLAVKNRTPLSLPKPMVGICSMR